MAKKAPRDEGRLPTKAEILTLLSGGTEATDDAESPGRIGKREIAKAFNIKGADKIELKRLLRELEHEGGIKRRGKTLGKAGQLPNMTVADIVGRDRDGDLLAKPTDWDALDRGPVPRILVHVPRDHRSGRMAPGVGDRVLLRIDTVRSAGADERSTHTGRFVKLLSKVRPRVLGVIRVDARVGARVIPVDKKNAAAEFIVQEAQLDGATDGELVAIEPIGRARGYGLQAVRVVERLGSTKSEHAVSTIAILTHGIPSVFSPEALAEAERVSPTTAAGREDWRALPLITIDPPDAKDHDDAVHAQPDEASDNPKGFVISVAIADVACLVAPGSRLDLEALERGNSVYFPDRVVPMLPERISTDLGSLRPHLDRPALAVRLRIGPDGHKKGHSFHRIIMRSAAKLSYAQAQAAIDGHPDDITTPLLEPVLRPLWAAYRTALKAREKRSPLDLDLPERKIVLNREGTVERVVVPERLDAHKLIEEFMILANVAAAETLEAKQQKLVYRVHDEPSLTKLHALQEFLQSLGINLAKGQVIRPALFNGVLTSVRGTEHEHLVNEVVLRSQAQAEYAVENYGHFGLNLQRYAHFTSPIRRYADLIVHRALIRALALGRDGLPDFEAQDLGETAARISAAERRAMAAERETTDRLIASFLADQIGASFQARISGVTRAGFFVKLSDTGADGFVPAATLGDEYFSYEEARHALVGTRTHKSYQLGDIVDVRLIEAAPLAGALRFQVSGDIGSKRSPREASVRKRGTAEGKRRMEHDVSNQATRRNRRHK